MRVKVFETRAERSKAYRPTHGPEPLVTAMESGRWCVRVHTADKADTPSILYRLICRALEGGGWLFCSRGWLTFYPMHNRSMHVKRKLAEASLDADLA